MVFSCFMLIHVKTWFHCMPLSECVALLVATNANLICERISAFRRMCLCAFLGARIKDECLFRLVLKCTKCSWGVDPVTSISKTFLVLVFSTKPEQSRLIQPKWNNIFFCVRSNSHNMKNILFIKIHSLIDFSQCTINIYINRKEENHQFICGNRRGFIQTKK